MSSPRSLLIFNPNADRGRCGNRAKKLLPLAQSIAEVDWQITTSPGHALDLAHEAQSKGYDRVVALGGDGTVHEVANGLMRQPPAERLTMGIVPIGSGNDVAFACHLPHDCQEALRRALLGDPKPIDVGLLKDPNGRLVYFDNSIGMMFDAAVNIQSRRIRGIYGFPMYLTAVLRALLENHRPTRTQLWIDGEHCEYDLVMTTVGNGPREGGGFLTTPQSNNDDGVLDLMLVAPISRLRMLRLLPVVMRGGHLNADCVTMKTCRRLVVETDSALPIHVDGELWAPYEMDLRRIEVELLPHALNVSR